MRNLFFDGIAKEGFQKEDFDSSFWIGGDKTANAICFSKDFSLFSRPLKAKLLISGLGFFESKINGQLTDCFYFKPFLTDYQKRPVRGEKKIIKPEIGTGFVHEFLIFDVTEFLKKGDNRFSVLVGNGYYQNEDRPLEPFNNVYGEKKLRFVLKVWCQEGVCVFKSDFDVFVQDTKRKMGLFRGNEIDFSMPFGEKKPSTRVISPKGSKPILLNAPRDVLIEKKRPLSFVRTKKGIRYDFGVNHTGGLHLLVRAKKGQKIRIGHAEILKDGEMDYVTSHYQELIPGTKIVGDRIDQFSSYTLSGGVDEIRPIFNWFCYRYAEIEGLEVENILSIESYEIHSDLKQNGVFDSVIPFYKEIQTKVLQTIYNNLHAGVITDCPTREKRPYTGDGQLITETMLYSLDSLSFFKKWLGDIYRGQRKDGFVPYTLPHLAGGGGYPWSVAIAKIPCLCYCFSGDIGFVKDSYSHILRFLSFIRLHSEDMIPGANGQRWLLGDWLAPEFVQFSVPLMSCACYKEALDIAAFFAKILRKQTDFEIFKNESSLLTQKVNKRFFDEEKMQYASGIQGENVLGFEFFLPHSLKEKMKKKIRKTYEDNGYAIDTGMVMTPILFDVLFQNDMADLALKILNRKKFPSYWYLLDGETSVPETWSKHRLDFFIGKEKIIEAGEELSHSHPMFGSVLGKLCRYVGGMDLFHLYEKSIVFAPKAVSLCPFASFSKTIGGEDASISYCLDKDTLKIDIHVPKGYRGTLSIASFKTEAISFAGIERKFAEGSFHLEFSLKADSQKAVV